MEDNNIMIGNDIDPDLNYFNSLLNCYYYDVNQTRSIFDENKHDLSIVGYNSRSFSDNFDSFFCIFDNSNQPDIMVICETWFTPYTIQDVYGYDGFHTIRSTPT